MGLIGDHRPKKTGSNNSAKSYKASQKRRKVDNVASKNVTISENPVQPKRSSLTNSTGGAKAEVPNKPPVVQTKPSKVSLCDSKCPSSTKICPEKPPACAAAFKPPACATAFKASEKKKINCDCPQKSGQPFQFLKSRPNKTCNTKNLKPLSGFPPYPYVKVLYVNETGIPKNKCKVCSPQKSTSCFKSLIGDKSKCSQQPSAGTCGSISGPSRCRPVGKIPCHFPQNEYTKSNTPTCLQHSKSPAIDQSKYPPCDCPPHASCNPPNPVQSSHSDNTVNTLYTRDSVQSKGKNLNTPQSKSTTAISDSKWNNLPAETTKSTIVVNRASVCSQSLTLPNEECKTKKPCWKKDSSEACNKKCDGPCKGKDKKALKWLKGTDEDQSKTCTENRRPRIDYQHKCLIESNCGVCYACRKQWSNGKKVAYGILGLVLFWTAVACPALLYWWLDKYQGGVTIELSIAKRNVSRYLDVNNDLHVRAASKTENVDIKSLRGHYVIMTLAFITGETLAMCFFRLFPFCPKWIVGTFHFLVHGGVAFGAYEGILPAWNYTKSKNILHIHSVHAYIGTVVLVLFTAQFLIGLFSFFIIAIASSADIYRERLAPIHSSVGISIFMLSILCCITGLRQESEAALTDNALMSINGIGLLFLTVPFLLSIFLSDYFKRPDQR